MASSYEIELFRIGVFMSETTLGIGEVAKLFGITTKTLRFYETTGLIGPDRAENGYRQFGPTHIRQIMRIRQLQALGLTLEQIRDILENEVDADRWQLILKTVLADINGQIDSLEARRQRVKSLLDGEKLVDAVAAQPIAIPELEDAALFLEEHLPEMGLLSLWQEQTIMAMLDPAGTLLTNLFSQTRPRMMPTGHATTW